MARASDGRQNDFGTPQQPRRTRQRSWPVSERQQTRGCLAEGSLAAHTIASTDRARRERSGLQSLPGSVVPESDHGYPNEIAAAAIEVGTTQSRQARCCSRPWAVRPTLRGLETRRCSTHGSGRKLQASHRRGQVVQKVERVDGNDLNKIRSGRSDDVRLVVHRIHKRMVNIDAN